MGCFRHLDIARNAIVGIQKQLAKQYEFEATVNSFQPGKTLIGLQICNVIIHLEYKYARELSRLLFEDGLLNGANR